MIFLSLTIPLSISGESLGLTIGAFPQILGLRFEGCQIDSRHDEVLFLQFKSKSEAKDHVFPRNVQCFDQRCKYFMADCLYSIQ